MVFKRRNKQSYGEIAAGIVYPRGGWLRAVRYLFHRLRRLPDQPHKIARGIAAGVFVCFTPFFGLHFLVAAVLTLAMQGNMLAAMIATFFGNPLTFPIIATVSIELGSWMLGVHGGIPLPDIVGAFSRASVELWTNFTAIFTTETVHWNRFDRFFDRVFLPYLVGGIVPGIIVSVAAYAISLPIISAYQKARIKRLKKRFEKKRAAAIARADAVVKAD